MNKIKDILMQRDGISEDDALELISLARQELDELLENGDIPDEAEFISKWFELEPDYIDELF